MFSFNNDDLTDEEKINYIYKRLKSQARMAMLSLIFKLFMLFTVFYSIYSLFTGQNSEIVDTISGKFRQMIIGIVSPMVTDILGNMSIPNLNSTGIQAQSLQNISSSQQNVPVHKNISNQSQNIVNPVSPSSGQNIKISPQDIQKILDTINKK